MTEVLIRRRTAQESCREGGGQESGTDRPAADDLFAEDGADAGMAGGAGREENDAGEPAAQASPDLELLSLFEDSVQFDEDGNLYFTIPQSSHAPEDWAISFSGKKATARILIPQQKALLWRYQAKKPQGSLKKRIMWKWIA